MIKVIVVKEEIDLFWNNVVEVAHQRKKSLRDISRGMGKSETLLGTLKNKRTPPNLKTIIAIARVLKVPVSRLVRGID